MKNMRPEYSKKMREILSKKGLKLKKHGNFYRFHDKKSGIATSQMLTFSECFSIATSENLKNFTLQIDIEDQ